MRVSSLLGPATAGFSAWSILATLQSAASAFSFNPAPTPDLDLSSLGRVVFTGDFDAVSIYSYEEQSSSQMFDDDTQSISTPLPNGILTTLSKSDAHILAMCPFTKEDGTFSGIFVGGNFTSLDGVEAHGIALFHPNSTKATPLPGLKGSVSALLCDQETNSVYVGGDLKHGNNSNAVAWVGDKGWTDLPFQGFNGPVSSIEKDDDGHIIFGGTFDGLGHQKSSSTTKRQQIVNLQTAEITSDAISDQDGYSDPRNVICQTSGKDGKGKTWLLADTSPGFWRARMGFDYIPSKLRLYNTHLDGRGTKSFLFRALPDNGIMNFTYSNPDSGHDENCDASCPLSSSKTEKYRDFHFVNTVGMSGFELEIQDWYGKGAGLNGIELFQNGECHELIRQSAIANGVDTYAYAINDFNEPSCANLDHPSQGMHTGTWTPSESGYLTTHVTNANATDSSVTFKPDIIQSGNYSIKVYTPGCQQDGTCDSRGIVNVTATVATGTESAAPIQTMIYQTNLYGKYDTIYTGHVDASSESFRPSVHLTPIPGQGDITVVASRVGFKQLSSSGVGGLNGLYDYDPSAKTTDAHLKKSAINRAGLKMHHGSSFLSLAKHDGVVYASGNFSDADIHNIMSVEGNATAMPEGGLNSRVDTMSVLDGVLYVGGNFTDTADGGNKDLKHIAAYSFDSKIWSALGGGVNGPVKKILSLPLNVSRDINETVVAVSGDFDQIRSFGDDKPSIPVPGFAVWVPSEEDWLQNLNVTQMQFAGQLSAFTSVNDTTILAGSLISDGIAAGAAVSLLYSDGFSLDPLMTEVDRSAGSEGTFTGIYDTKSGRNLTIVGGRFRATTTDGSTIENLAILDGEDGSVAGWGEGVDSNSTILSLAVSGDTLYAGGNVTGKVSGSSLKGFVAYDLSSGDFVDNQPTAFTGPHVSVNSIVTRPSSSEVYFGGNFESAGDLPCPSVCYFDTKDQTWNRPGASITGPVLQLEWASDKDLYAVGNFNVDGNDTVVATYNTKKDQWKAFKGAGKSEIPGPVTAFTPASTDISRFWLAGESSNGSSYLLDYDGSKFRSTGNIFDKGTTIRGLEALPLSENHDDNDLLKNDLALLITGQLVIPDFGNASAALFNGSALTPFILSSTYEGQSGSMSHIITENKNPYSRECKFEIARPDGDQY